MKKRFNGLLLALLIAPAIFSSHTSQAFDIKAASVGMVAFIKNCFSPASLKAATYTSAHALWHVAKVTAIVTVLGNILLPTKVRCALAGQSGLRRFVFKWQNEWV